jgi:pimeloyl-ACP methyl ester carboxylesterase
LRHASQKSPPQRSILEEEAVLAFVERIAYEVAGSGEPVLLIHGLGGSSNTWTPLRAAFARRQCIALDLPGSARSARVEGGLSADVFMNAVLKVMKKIGIERTHVAAHSMGTIVAAHLAAAHPEKVASLALFGPLLAPPEQARIAIRARAAKAREGDMQPIADALVQASLSSESRSRKPAVVAYVRESLMRQYPEGYARSCEALAEMQPADTTRIGCPTLLVTGDEDAVAPPQSVRMMGQKIAGSRVEVLRGCGHWTPVEKPEECVALLMKFLERRTPWQMSSSPTYA